MLRRDFFKRVLGGCAAAALAAIPGAKVVKGGTVVRQLGLKVSGFNAVTLRKKEWMELDAAVLRVQRDVLRRFADLQVIRSTDGSAEGYWKGVEKVNV